MNEQSQKTQGGACGSSKCFCLLCCICICATIGYVAYLYYGHPSHRRLWLPVMIQKNGSETILGDTRQLEFWTPSIETKDYLHKTGDQITAGEQWEVISNDDSVTEFGMLLHSNADVLGYRRVEVWGQGQTSYKPGWWWTVNVFSNYSVVDFASVYRSYWKSASPVFVEVIDSRGSKAEQE